VKKSTKGVCQERGYEGFERQGIKDWLENFRRQQNVERGNEKKMGEEGWRKGYKGMLKRKNGKLGETECIIGERPRFAAKRNVDSTGGGRTLNRRETQQGPCSTSTTMRTTAI